MPSTSAGMDLAHEPVRVSHAKVQQVQAAGRTKRDAAVHVVGMVDGAGRGWLIGGPRLGQPGDRGGVRVCVAKPPAEAVIRGGEPG